MGCQWRGEPQCWFSVTWRVGASRKRHRVSKYSAIFGGPVCTAQRSGGWRKGGQQTETATGFEKEIMLGSPIHHRVRAGAGR